MHHFGATTANFAAGGCGAGAASQTCKATLDLGHDRLVLDRTRRRYHHVRPAIMRFEISMQHVAVEPLQRLRRTEQRTPDRLVRIAELVEMLENNVVRSVLRRTHFLLDDAFLAFEFLRVEARIGQDIAQHVERERNVGPSHARNTPSSQHRSRH